MADSPTLRSLPTEVLEHIAEHLEPKDVRALRLTCREIADNALRTFANIHFNNLKVYQGDWWSHWSARKVVDHRVFGPVVRKVTVHVSSKAPDHSRDLDTRRTLPRSCMANGESDLVDLFDALSKHGRAIEVEASVPTRDPSQYRSVTAEHVWCDFQRYDYYDWFHALISALSRTQLKTSSLSIGAGLAATCGGRLIASRPQCRQVFARLETFHLDVSPFRTGFNCPHSHDPSLAELLTCAEKLKNLAVIVKPKAYSNSMADAILRASMFELESLSLNGHRLEFDALLDFTQRHSGLKELNLLNVRLDGLRSKVDEATFDSVPQCEFVKKHTGVPGEYSNVNLRW